MIMLVEHKDESSSASVLRETLSERLLACFGLSFDRLLQSFTFVTDCAAVMPNIVGASVSTSVAPLNHKWAGCIVHQLNTVMKTTILQLSSSVNMDLYLIHADLSRLKSIVRIFEQSGLNAKLPKGKVLEQAVETRFSTTFTVVERFLFAAKEVYRLAEDTILR